MTAPFDKFLKSLRDGNSEAERLRKLMRAYPSRFVRFSKQDDGGEASAGTWDRGPYADESTPPRDEEDYDRRVDDLSEEDDEAAAADEEARLREEDDDAGVEATDKRHFVDVLSGLLIDAGTFATKPEALHYLLHHRDGAALVRRLHKQRKRLQKEAPPMKDTLSAIAKQYGVVAVCKHITDRGSSNISEHDLVKVVADTVTRLPGETREQAFVRAFSADDEEGLAMRKAVQVLKRHPRAEGTVSGSAYDAIVAKATELRKREPSLTREQSFAKAYQENPDLAREERRQNRPAA